MVKTAKPIHLEHACAWCDVGDFADTKGAANNVIRFVFVFRSMDHILKKFSTNFLLCRSYITLRLDWLFVRSSYLCRRSLVLVPTTSE